MENASAWDPAQASNALQLVTEVSNGIPVVDLYVGAQKVDMLTSLLPASVYLYGNGVTISMVALTSASYLFPFFTVSRSGTYMISCPLVFGDSVVSAGILAGTSYNTSMTVNELNGITPTGSRGCSSCEIITTNGYVGFTAVMYMNSAYKYQVVWNCSKAGKAYLPTPIAPLINGTFTSAGFYVTPLSFQPVSSLGSSSFVLSSS